MRFSGRASLLDRGEGDLRAGVEPFDLADSGAGLAPGVAGAVVARAEVGEAFGTVRLRITATPAGTPVFTGIAPAGAAGRYLSRVAYATITGSPAGHPSYAGHAGGTPAVPPAQAGIWTVKATGPGTKH